MKRLALIAIGLLFFQSTTLAAVPSIERDALVVLYNSTNGAGWKKSTNWLTGDPCTNNWHGVVCDENANIIELNLVVNRLSGAIPPELGNLTNLRMLQLPANRLIGAIPPELGRLTNLNWCYMHNNKLNGSIPSELGNLENLIALSLKNNQLSGSIPAELGKLTRLVDLSLNSNSLSGSIPPELGNIHSLDFLMLHTNNLNGSIPAELSKLTKLTYLDFHSNRLSGSIPAELGKLVNLRGLSLWSNQLSGPIPPELGNMNLLFRLGLNDNQLSGSIPSELGRLTNLYVLSLNDNRLSGAISAELGNLTNLSELHLNSNQLTGTIPPDLSNLTNLEILNLAWNALHTSDPTLDTFLDSKQIEGNWSVTQTIPPTNLTTTITTSDSVKIVWDPIEYIENEGGYRVWYGTSSGGPYLNGGITANKKRKAHIVSGLNSGQGYYFVVRTKTNSHSNNENIVVSDKSTEVFSLTMPAWPTDIDASDGTHLNRVRINWSNVVGEDRYKVYRCTTVMTGSCGTPISKPGANVTSHDDFDASDSGTVYYYRIKACNATGCSRFSDYNAGNRKPAMAPPTVSTKAVSSVGQSSSKLNGKTNPNGSSTKAWFRYSTSTSYDSTTLKVDLGSGHTTKNNSMPVTGLHCDTTYHFQAVAQNSEGVRRGNDSTFKTSSCMPVNRFVDFNHDGKDDVLARHQNAGHWYINFMSFRFKQPNSGPTYIFSNPDWEMKGAGDFNGDGRGDILLRSINGGGWWIFLMVGRTNTAGSTLINKNRDWVIAGVDDFDGDGKDDVLLRHSVTGRWYINFMDAWTVRPNSGLTPIFASLTWEMMGTGDFNGDSYSDVLLRNRKTGVWWMFLMKGRVREGGITLISSDQNWVIAGIADFDGDGKDDVLLRNHVTGRWYINFMNSRLVRPRSGQTPIFANMVWKMMGTGDFNESGRGDVLLRNENTGVWWMFMMKGRNQINGKTLINEDKNWKIPYKTIDNP